MANTSPAHFLQSKNQHVVKEALAYAEDHLSTLPRESGEDYRTHGIEVALTLEEVSQDPTLISVAILHDLLSHERGEELLKASPLDADARDLLMRMYGLRHLHIDNKTEDLDRVISAFTEDSRLLLLRMAHRLNDVRHLDRFGSKRKREIAYETLNMYAAISGRLGFHRWRWQMEDTCFQVLQPRIADHVREQFDAHRELDKACLSHARLFLQQKLSEHGIGATIDERIKGVYSTYRKMVLKKRNFEELADRLALRILVPTVDDCYRALGVIHASMYPMHSKLKDYIGTPKENGYRSIHTVVYPLPGVSQFPIEIQVRTPEMHRECEYGIASHGDYKNNMYALNSPSARVNLFRNLEHLQSITKSNRNFTEALKRSFSSDHLIIFDPQNNLHNMSRPATAIDFACQVYPDHCIHIESVRINGRERPLNTELNDGDTVDIMLSDSPVPLKDHLRACKQQATKKLLKKAWKKQEQAEERLSR